MAKRLLLNPGFGGRYTSETFVSTDTVGADEIDTSHCAQFAIQVTSASGVGDVQVEQSFDRTNWANLGSTFSVATNGAILRFGPVDGPYGLIRINPTGITSGTASFVIVGHPVQGMF